MSAASNGDGAVSGQPGKHVSPLLARDYKVVWRVVMLLGLLQVCYSVAFIIRSSVVVEGQRWFCLFDDAMISMRYAHNWAHGDGLVWNPAERVEGYTNLGWTMVMGACHLLPLSPSHTCLLVQCLGIPVLWSCLVAAALLARACRLLPVTAICAIVLVATCYNLLYFTLLGLETGILCVIITVALYKAVVAIQRREGHVGSLLWFAPAALVRTDAILLCLYTTGFLLFTVRKKRLQIAVGLAVVLSVLAGHFLWRKHYYQTWLPNTYYLKLTGWPLAERLATGVGQSTWMAVQFGLPFFLALMALLAPKRWQSFLLGSFLVVAAYQVCVGGDAWPLNRFVIPGSIGLFVVAAQGIHRVLMVFFARRTRLRVAAVRVTLTFLCVGAMDAIHWDHCLLVASPQTTSDKRMNIRLFLALEKVADADASVAVAWAGTVPYYSRHRCVDLLGKCDPYIAHLPAIPGIRRPGHNKYDIAYSLSRHKPDVVLHALPLKERVFRQRYRPVAVEVDGEQVAFFVRNASRHVHGGVAIPLQRAVEIIRRQQRE